MIFIYLQEKTILLWFLDREDVEDMIDIEELNEIIKVEEMEKILLKKINELYIDGEFVRYVDEYLDMRP